MCRNLSGNTGENGEKWWKHALKTLSGFITPRQSFAVEFVVFKHFR